MFENTIQQCQQFTIQQFNISVKTEVNVRNERSQNSIPEQTCSSLKKTCGIPILFFE